MGTVLRLLGRNLRIFGVAALAALTACPALADSAPVPAGQMQSRVDMQNFNGQMENFAGYVVEKKMLSVGATPQQADAGAKAVTASYPSHIAAYWKQITQDASSYSSVTAPAGCVVGGLVAGVAGGSGGPAAIAAGCGTGSAIGSLVGGFAGIAHGTWVCLTQGCEVQVQKPDSMNEPVAFSGSLAEQLQRIANNNDGQLWLSGCQVANHGSDNSIPVPYGCSDSLTNPYQKYGIGHSFACSVGGAIHACALVAALGPSAFYLTTTSGSLYLGQSNNYGLSWAANEWVATLNSPLCIQPCMGVGNAINLSGNNWIALGISSQTYPSNTSVPYVTYSLQPSIPGWAGLLQNRVDPNAADLEASNKLLAAMINDMWKNAPTGDYPSYNPNNPVSEGDIANAKSARPDLKPTLGDTVLRPFVDPYGSNTGASGTSPVSKPLTVQTPPTINTGGTGGGTTTVNVNTSVDLGPSGDQTMPSTSGSDGSGLPGWDTITASLNPWRNLVIPSSTEACPVYPIDVPNFFGLHGHWQIDAHCVLLADGTIPDYLLGVIMLIFYTWVAARIVLKA